MNLIIIKLIIDSQSSLLYSTVMIKSPYLKKHESSKSSSRKSNPKVISNAQSTNHYHAVDQQYDYNMNHGDFNDTDLFVGQQEHSYPVKKIGKIRESISKDKNKNMSYRNNNVVKGPNSERSREKSTCSRLKTQQISQYGNRSPTTTSASKSKYSVYCEDKVQVFVKFKPPSFSTLQSQQKVRYVSDKEVEIQRQTNNKIYTFDQVFHHNQKSKEIFQIGCKDLIQEVIKQGKNGLIFVYGHTGTGKTYTMGLLDSIGHKSQGIVPESLRYIFSLPIKNIMVSFTQIYLDEVYDMLDFQGQKKMNIRQGQKNKQPYIQNLINISVNSIEEAYQLLNIGLQKRKIAEQRINKRSSRGHGLITLTILSRETNKVSKLCFVDLAGSERIKQSDSVGVTLNQAVHINTSLSALETLLMNIHEKSVRIYRGNKLTRLLQPFFESGKIRLFVTSNYENIQPIQFAKRCKGIKFMEREVLDESAARKLEKKMSEESSNLLKEYKDKTQKLQTMNKNIFYCLTNLLGIVVKINHYISELLDSQQIHSTFSLSENLSIKNQALEIKVNKKINQMEAKQEQILQKAQNTKYDGSIQDIIGLINQPGAFMKKIHNIGLDIFNSSKQLSSLAEYRNIFKKQIFVSQLKTTILQNKNEQFQNAINHLLKMQSPNSQNKLTKQLKQIGIVIQKSSMTLKSNKPDSIQILTKKQDVKGQKTPEKHDEIKKTKGSANTENSPLNRSRFTPTKIINRGQILIED